MDEFGARHVAECYKVAEWVLTSTKSEIDFEQLTADLLVTVKTQPHWVIGYGDEHGRILVAVICQSGDPSTGLSASVATTTAEICIRGLGWFEGEKAKAVERALDEQHLIVRAEINPITA